MTKKKMSSGKKIGIIAGSVGGVLLLTLILAFILATGSSTTTAFLSIENGKVQVDTGKGWISAIDGMQLGRDDKIKTGVDGEASLILYESAIVSLEPNTEISVDELSQEKAVIKQATGSTWNKFTGITGIKSLEIETPETVATVRGTEFGVTLNGVEVIEGVVDTKNKKSGKITKVSSGSKATVVDEEIILSELSVDEKRKLLVKMEKNIIRLNKLRDREMNKHPILLNRIKKIAKIDNQGLKNKINDIDEGRLDARELQKKSPFKAKSIDKFVKITEVIKEHRILMDEVRSSTEDSN